MTEVLKNKGFEDDFVKEYGSVIFSKKNLRRFYEGDPALMNELENYHDEWNFFKSGFDEDTLVVERI